jgi:hypothetical protein
MRVLFIVLLLLLREAGAVYTTLAAGPNFGILFSRWLWPPMVMAADGYGRRWLWPPMVMAADGYGRR